MTTAFHINLRDGPALEVLSNDFVAFIDETGDESLRDPKYPLFGLGGCGVMAGDYLRLISKPWCHMKDLFFGGATQHLHACDLRKPSDQQLRALSSFFQGFWFSRFASVLTDRSLLDERHPPYAYAAGSLLKRLEAVARWHPFKRMFLLFEASERGDRLVARHFGNLQLADENGSMDVTVGGLPKSACEPGLEVADFIMHAVGGHARQHLRGGGPRRKDFAAIFDMDPRLVSHMLIEKATVSPSEGQQRER